MKTWNNDIHARIAVESPFQHPGAGEKSRFFVFSSSKFQRNPKVENSKLILLEKGDKLKVYGLTDAKFLLIAGKPIGEQIARGGPFVMNTKQEILQAVEDYHKGTFVKWNLLK